MVNRSLAEQFITGQEQHAIGADDGDTAGLEDKTRGESIG